MNVKAVLKLDAQCRRMTNCDPVRWAQSDPVHCQHMLKDLSKISLNFPIVVGATSSFGALIMFHSLAFNSQSATELKDWPGKAVVNAFSVSGTSKGSKLDFRIEVERAPSIVANWAAMNLGETAHHMKGETAFLIPTQGGRSGVLRISAEKPGSSLLDLSVNEQSNFPKSWVPVLARLLAGTTVSSISFDHRFTNGRIDNEFAIIIETSQTLASLKELALSSRFKVHGSGNDVWLTEGGHSWGISISPWLVSNSKIPPKQGIPVMVVWSSPADGA